MLELVTLQDGISRSTIQKEFMPLDSFSLLLFGLPEGNASGDKDPCIYPQLNWERVPLSCSLLRHFGHIWVSGGLRQKPVWEARTSM